MNIEQYNRMAWDKKVEAGSPWTVPVTSAEIDAARQGEWQIMLTPTKPLPQAWLSPLTNLDVLALASGGGQQGPLLAAAGANVTVLDNSAAQLAQDAQVAQRDRLSLRMVQGDMADLHMFADASFDLIINPVSNVFVPDVHPVWREAYRVLRPNGTLLAGFMNPVYYIFDHTLLEEEGQVAVKYSLPYADRSSLSPTERAAMLAEERPFEFSHTLDDQIGGQIGAGFAITGFYEDNWPPTMHATLAQYMPCFMVTRATKQVGA